jgi:hypothetical protein
MSIHRIVYTSRATEPFDAEALIELLGHVRAKNRRLGISGMLLYADPTFLQVIEGDLEVIESLYDVIESDRRHADTRVLLREDAEGRAFGDWTMGFVQADREMLASVAGLNDFLQSQRGAALIPDEQTARVEKLLEQFKSGRWRREIEG